MLQYRSTKINPCPSKTDAWRMTTRSLLLAKDYAYRGGRILVPFLLPPGRLPGCGANKDLLSRVSSLGPGGLACAVLPNRFENHRLGLDPPVSPHRQCRRYCSVDCMHAVAVRTTFLKITSGWHQSRETEFRAGKSLMFCEDVSATSAR